MSLMGRILGSSSISRRVGPAVRLYLLPALALAWFTLAQQVLISFLPLYFDFLGMSQAHIAALLSLFPLLTLLFTFPSGIAGDASSPKRLALLGLSVFSLSTLVLKALPNLSLLPFALILVAAGGILFSLNCSTIYYKSLGSEGRGRKVGLLSALVVLGAGMGPLLAGQVLKSEGMGFLFPLCFLLSLPAFCFALLMRDVEPKRSALTDYGRDLRRREVWAFVAVVLLHSVHIGVESVCLALFLKYRVGLSLSLIGLVLFLNCFFFSMGVTGFGFFSDRRKCILPLLALGLLLSGWFNLLMPAVKSFGVLVGVRFFHVLGDSGVALARGLLVASLFPRERMGGGLGLVNFLLPAGMLCGMALSGALGDYLRPFLVAGALEVLALSFLPLLGPRKVNGQV